MFSDNVMSDFLSRHRLPRGFRDMAEHYYLPLARQLIEIRKDDCPLLIGVNGAQGTGKSTLADFLRVATESMFNWNVAVISIDDFYLTSEERKDLAGDVHPLFMTRGVPGTHDTEMLAICLDRLQKLGSNEQLAIPRFDKAADDRADKSQWTPAVGPIDLVILEGWCVGSEAQPDRELEEPVNSLEREDDPEGIWRKYANDQLRSNYQQIFEQLDFLIYINAPDFDSILRWRLKQERKLAEVSASNSAGLMTDDQIVRFMQFYERITRANQVTIPRRANIIFDLDDTHSIISTSHEERYEKRPGLREC